MMSGYKQIDAEWSYFLLDPMSISFKYAGKWPALEVLLEQSDFKPQGAIDCVQTYNEIAYFFDDPITNPGQIASKFLEYYAHPTKLKRVSRLHKIKVDYSLGMDWAFVEDMVGKSQNEIIALHTGTKYTLAMYGFLPGFMYLDGLDPALSCSRKTLPRKNVPAGSVGIGGHQTGIYSLNCPGGWQIIGRSEYRFDIDLVNSEFIKPGDHIQFIAD